jgi:hypothetical protein
VHESIAEEKSRSIAEEKIGRQDRPAADARAAATSDPSNGESGTRVMTPMAGGTNPGVVRRASMSCSSRALTIAA